MDREALAWALVLSLPPGVGIAGFAAFVLGRGFLDPLAWAAGAVTALAIFSIFAFAVAVGSEDERRAGDGPG